MLRFSSILSFLFLALSGISAQNETSSTGRLAVQQLSPEEAYWLMETKEVDDFSRTLQSLKIAYTEKDTRRAIAYQANILLAMRTEIDQTSAKTASGGQAASEARLAKMSQLLQSFDQPSFDPADPAAAEQDFDKLEVFLSLMQEELAASKMAKH